MVLQLRQGLRQGGLRRGGLRPTGTLRDAILSSATDATLVYIAAVEAADGQRLEDGVLAAMVTFANWRIPLGGACCLMAGPRTLDGALTPLVGVAPTAVNFVSEDYDRKTGLQGVAVSGKRIDSNTKLPQTGGAENSHMSLHGTTLDTGRIMGVFRSAVFTRHYLLGGLDTQKTWGSSYTTTLRSSGHLISTRLTGGDPLLYFNGVLDATFNTDNSIPSDWNVGVFVANGSVTGLSSEAPQFANYSNARLTHYSIGPGLTPQQCTDFHALTSAINTTVSALP